MKKFILTLLVCAHLIVPEYSCAIESDELRAQRAIEHWIQAVVTTAAGGKLPKPSGILLRKYPIVGTRVAVPEKKGVMVKFSPSTFAPIPEAREGSIHGNGVYQFFSAIFGAFRKFFW